MNCSATVSVVCEWFYSGMMVNSGIVNCGIVISAIGVRMTIDMGIGMGIDQGCLYFSLHFLDLLLNFGLNNWFCGFDNCGSNIMSVIRISTVCTVCTESIGTICTMTISIVKVVGISFGFRLCCC